MIREPHEADRRQIRVFPTERALQLLPEIRRVFRVWRNYLEEELTEEELAVFCDIMQRVTQRAAARCGRIVMEEEA